VHAKTETQDISQLLYLLGTILKAAKVAKVLGNSPNSLLGVNVFVIPIDQLMGGS
jgi:hypothetical protein